MYVSELIVFMRGHNILCIAEVLRMFMNFIHSFISVYDDAYVYAFVWVFVYIYFKHLPLHYILFYRPV